MVFKDESAVSRRTFVKGSLAGLALASTAGSAALFGCTQPNEKGATDNKATTPTDEIVWSQCHVNCGGRCVFQYHVKDGKIVYMESDNTGAADGIQARACQRGRSIRRWINHPDRLGYPMKRVGKRGEGTFEKISWDEAIDTIAEKLKHTIDTYGNEAVFIKHDNGNFSITSGTMARLMNSCGGFLDAYNNYSTANMVEGIKYTFGPEASPGNPDYASSMSEAMNADLVLLFGNSPAETRMGGANTTYTLSKVRAAGVEIISIDPRMNETCSGHPDEWQPIRTGTDAALVAAIAHELISNDGVNLDFLHTYCIGYDEETMPEASKAQNKSYKDYVMGTGYDMVEKTPEWAEPITQIPAERIRLLAEKIQASKALFVAQGWSPQRHSNGEIATRAICMLPLLTGMVGKAGTNSGLREANPPAPVSFIPSLDNPVKTTISCYNWIEAINRGTEMTALKDGVRGADKLGVGVKFLWCFANNCLTNQHGDINGTHDILVDESKCEFIVVIDTVLTDSAKYADILLPDAMRAEHHNLDTNGYAEWYTGVNYGMPAQEPAFECRSNYDINAAIAEKMGVGDVYTEGRSQEDWIEYMYGLAQKEDSALPALDQLKKDGLYKRELAPAIGLEAYYKDPKTNALSTPSGKIEIYSEDLAQIAETWELADGDVISPIPIFDPGREGYTDLTEEYPLLCSGFHFKGRTHSSYGFIEELKQANRQQAWINVLDAQERGIVDGDMCSVKSPRGEMRIEAKVTPRMIPGVISIPEGAWHDADMKGDRIDHGGCINTLLMPNPTPLAKGNPSHSIIVQVAKA